MFWCQIWSFALYCRFWAVVPCQCWTAEPMALHGQIGMTDVKIAAMLIDSGSGGAGKAGIINIRAVALSGCRGEARLLCSVTRSRNILLTHETYLWTFTHRHEKYIRLGVEKRIMHDLAKQNTPQAWLCMASTLTLSGWCLFKRGSRDMYRHTARERPTQSLPLHLT